MRASFEEAKDVVLVAVYETLYHFSEWEAFKADDIHERLKDVFALGFTRRVLSNLSAQKLITSDSYDESSPVMYSLTDEGIHAAEQLPALNTLVARLRDYSSGVQGDIAVPASDRIVRLNHNQVEVAVQPVDELLNALEQDNGNPDQPGLRERLIGQIKAGRELIRAGEFRAYLLYEVLVRALGELIKHYKNPTITALANALLGAVVGQLIQGQ